MKIGFSKIDITPPIFTCSNGGIVYKTTETHKGVHDSLFARAIFLDDGNTCAVMVSMDLLSILKSSVIKIKKMIKEYCEISEQNIILHTTHQHSGPYPYKYKDGIRNNAYWTVTEQQIAGAAYMAKSNIKDFFIGAGKSSLEYSLNRRILQEDGKVLYLSNHPGLKPNQIVDNEIGVISFRKLDNRPLVTLINYSCHPLTVGFVPGVISADYPGETVKQVEKRLFGSAIFTNGACANIHPRKHCEGIEAMKDFGCALADKILDIMPFIEVDMSENLKIICDKITLDLIPEKMDENEDIREFRKGNTIDFEISIIALNDIAFVAIPGEYFVEFQLEIKKKSSFKHTYLLTNSNGYFSYIPDSKAYDQGGYEVNATKFQKGSGELIKDKILQLLKKLSN
jgi:hypothetical protein